MKNKTPKYEKTAAQDVSDAHPENEAVLEDNAITRDASIQVDQEVDQAISKEPVDTPEETDTSLSEPEIIEADGPSTLDEGSNDSGEAIVAEPQQPEARSSFFPMLLGGVAAGAIGFAAAFFGLAQKPDDALESINKNLDAVSTTVETQGTEIVSITADLDAMPSAIAQAQDARLVKIEEAVSRLGPQFEDFAATLSLLDERITTLEKRPLTDSVSDAAIAAYEKELQTAADSMAQQRAELEALIAEAKSSEGAAEEAALATVRRTAISKVISALENGTVFNEAIVDLENSGTSVPDILASVSETGVASINQLMETFPEAARSALAVARLKAAESGEASGLSGFLKSQLGARSLEPREGTDPDAILSRAEAAVREGRLDEALSEIDGLDEAAQSELSGWSGRARLRLDALQAAQTLSTNLN